MFILFRYVIGNLRQRWVGTGLTVFSFSLVTVILIVLLSMVKGIEKTLMPEGREDRFMVIGNGNSENQSRLDDENPALISAMPEIRYDAKGLPLTSYETVASAKLKSQEGGMFPQVVRGVDLERARQVHEDLRIVQGRFFTRNALDEIALGKGASQLLGAKVGDRIRMRQRDWKVVGVFADGSSPSESEIWTSRENMSAYFRKDFVSSVWGKVRDKRMAKPFTEKLNKDPRLSVFAYTEREYFQQGARTAQLYKMVGWLVAGFLSIGAIFSAMNTMFASMGARAKEFATLRALGFSKGVVFGATLSEALVIAFIGGLAACLISIPVDGLPLTVNMAGIGKVVYEIDATAEVRTIGLIFAIVLGTVSGWLPARNATRGNIVEGLKG